MTLTMEDTALLESAGAHIQTMRADNDTLRACLRKARLANEQLRAQVEALTEENRVLKLANKSFAETNHAAD